MKKSIRSLFVLLLVGLFIFNPMVAEAARFSDVDRGHWAYEYIEELTGNDVIKGYPNGEFKPDNYVSYLEILELLKGVKDLPKSDMNYYVGKNKTTLEKYGVPAWAHEAVAVALEENIITVDNLAAAYSQGLITDFPKEGQYPNREAIAVYYAKALGMKGIENHDNLKYKDIDQIGASNNPLIGKTNVKNYLAALIEEGIFADTGSDGNFEPKRPLRRAEMAKITDLSYKYAHRTTEDLEGRIIHLGDVYAKNLIFIQDEKGEKHTLILDDSTKIKVDDKSGSYDDLKVNQKVTATVTGNIQNKELLHTVELNVKTDKIVGTGIIESIDDEKVKISYVEKFQAIHPDAALETKVTDEFGFDEDLEIIQFDQKKSFNNLGKDVRVRFIADNGLINKIYIVPLEANVEGTVVDVKSDTKFEREGKLTLKLSDDTEYDFYVDDRQLYGIKPSQLKDLEKGDNVRITVFSDFIAALNPKLAQEKAVGYIESVVNYGNRNDYTINLAQADGTKLSIRTDSKTTYNEGSMVNAPVDYSKLNRLVNEKRLIEVKLDGDRAIHIDVLSGSVTEINDGTIKITSIEPDGPFGEYTLYGQVRYNTEVEDIIIYGAPHLRPGEIYNFTGYRAGNKIVANLNGQSEPINLQITK